MNVLIIGSGGREHALARACAQSPSRPHVFAAPGSDGIASCAKCLALPEESPEAIVSAARSCKADLVVVGPEAPLAAGAGDALRAAGFLVCGPNRDGAQLEASKAFSKAFMHKHGIPTGNFRTFRRSEPALEWLRKVGAPVVVKASGLAAGKGVIVARELAEAEEAVRSMLEQRRFGESGAEVVVEEFLEGEEASFMVLVSGQEYRLLPCSQDHKAIGEGDTGPNTGGMGAYAPAAVVTPRVRMEVEERIIRPTLRGLFTEAIDYRGVLYVGVMLTADGPKVLEYNVRFGDPECQVLLPLLRSDPVELLSACARGKLATHEPRFHDGAAMTVVLAARGYPGSYEKDLPLTLPEAVPEECWVVHAGTRRDEGGQWLSTGGRVLCASARGSSLREAAERAYALCDAIDFPGGVFRRDIGHRQLSREAGA
jgi:phosphoribosylamine--glycine ligase